MILRASSVEDLESTLALMEHLHRSGMMHRGGCSPLHCMRFASISYSNMYYCIMILLL